MISKGSQAILRATVVTERRYQEMLSSSSFSSDQIEAIASHAEASAPNTSVPNTILTLVRALRQETARADKVEEIVWKGIQDRNDPCYYCSKPCSSLAANPGMWPIAMCHEEAPGVVKWHHTSCVEERLARLADFDGAE